MPLLKRTGERKKKKKNTPKTQPVQISGQALCLHLEPFRIPPEAQLERKPGAHRQLLPAALPFVHMGCSWPRCEAGPLAGAQIPSAPRGASPGPPGSPPWNRARRCRIGGASGLSPAFAEVPSKESRLLPFPPKPAEAGNPQKSARKGQGGSWGGKQLKIGLPGRLPWRSRSICK